MLLVLILALFSASAKSAYCDLKKLYDTKECGQGYGLSTSKDMCACLMSMKREDRDCTMKPNHRINREHTLNDEMNVNNCDPRNALYDVENKAEELHTKYGKLESEEKSKMDEKAKLTDQIADLIKVWKEKTEVQSELKQLEKRGPQKTCSKANSDQKYLHDAKDASGCSMGSNPQNMKTTVVPVCGKCLFSIQCDMNSYCCPFMKRCINKPMKGDEIYTCAEGRVCQLPCSENPKLNPNYPYSCIEDPFYECSGFNPCKWTQCKTQGNSETHNYLQRQRNPTHLTWDSPSLGGGSFGGFGPRSDSAAETLLDSLANLLD